MSDSLCLDPLVQTTHGKVRGKLRKTVYGDDYYCFDGIPYAKAPLGELRFKAPQDNEPWLDVRDCTEVAPKCLQFNRHTQKIEGSEDCLYLNIYVKNLNTIKALPVMVYIHGGMFKTGDASRLSWGPDYFMMKEIILITIGHRLGPLGFLRFSDPSLNIPGNAGIKDQVQALKWIKENCSFFNGDPENITLFGHSSGSTSTQLLMLNSKLDGMFQKAVLMSGNTLSLSRLPDLEYRLAKCLDYYGENNDKDIYKFLSSLDPKRLLNVNILTNEEKKIGFATLFSPYVESYETKDSIILEQPIDQLQSAWSNKIPIMIGNTSMEALIQYEYYTTNKEFYESCEQNPEYLLPIILQSRNSKELQRKQTKRIINLHYGAKEVAIENANCAIELESYRLFHHSAHRFMLARRSNKYNAKTYLYRFDFDSPYFNLYRIKLCGPVVRGVAHVDDLSYLFFMPTSFRLARDSAEFKTIERMIDIWTNFANSSNPNAPCIFPIVWKPLEREKPGVVHECLNISNDISFIKWPEAMKCKVWDSLYEESKEKLF